MGVMAVEGFVVLSGFVITQLILTKRESYGTFIFRRFMRLFPIFLVCLLISMALRPITVGEVYAEIDKQVDLEDERTAH